MERRPSALGDDETPVLGTREVRDGAFEVDSSPQVDRGQGDALRLSRRLDGSKLAHAGGRPRIADDSRLRHGGGNLLKQFQPFAAHVVVESGKSGDVTAGPRHAFHNARPDRVEKSCKYNRNTAGRLLQ